MTYILFARNEVANIVKSEAQETSYRHLSQRINQNHPNHKISPSKLCRIANQKQDISAHDLEVLINTLNIPLDAIWITFPF